MHNANDAGLKGAGVAKVELVNGEPTVTQRLRGQRVLVAIRQHAPIRRRSCVPGPTIRYVCLLRVKAADAYDLDRYEYWWGPNSGWKTGKLLTEFGARTAVAWLIGQGQIVWSEFYECYIFAHLSPGGSDVLLRTATSLQGPWTPDVKVFTATPMDDGLTYAGVAHPYLDPSGQTLTISYTNNNHIEVFKLSFLK
ncbi:uncharacterized protein F4817DRAFT_314216 [Daldinia loculata]|uniref:uncharacterized protein n=1 Tax=Daldinia loculata TaxID=103429 RepID=UPI0020C592C8|nr:uncharacterized protein F4817DRAFT_314216 [Daldinia loculata]KAI1648923.1 hypothetical protein F4817DRAFT_314216 [Daldinia loculata]